MHKSILLPVDLNEDSSWKKAALEAIRMAEADGAELHVVTVIPNFGFSLVGSFFPPDFEEKAMAETKKALAEFVAKHFPDSLNIKTHVLRGTIYKQVLQLANSLGCDLIVLASHRPGTQDYLLGPNAARVVRHASQSVHVVRD